ncbi:cold-shock protein, partial [Micrococcus sp. HSID17228]
MPTGRIKFYDSTKGFGFAQTDEGEEVHVPASALPAGVTELRGGTRV